MLEKQIRAQIIRHLRGHKIYAYVQRNTGLKVENKFGGARWIKANMLGIPDIVGFFGASWGIHAGKAVYIEVKRPGNNRINPHQELFLSNAVAAGCFAIKAYSLEEVIKEIEKWQSK